MDAEILHAIWFECKDLSDTQHKLLLALAYHCHHGYTCFPSIPRLAAMIRRKRRQTHTLLHELERVGYITIQGGGGRKHPNQYTLKVQKLLHGSKKPGNNYCTSKRAIAIAPELLMEEEREKEENPEALLLKLGLTRGSVVWIAAMNGHQK
jgi:Helix-turn-helix domain